MKHMKTLPLLYLIVTNLVVDFFIVPVFVWTESLVFLPLPYDLVNMDLYDCSQSNIWV